MMIRAYVVTYKRNDLLNENLRTLWATVKDPSGVEVLVLSNHPDVEVAPENARPNLKVIVNATRPLNAWGYLSRDWNFCILDAFKSWRNERGTSWCVLSQNDATWVDGWDQWLKANGNYDLVSQPAGDQSVAMNIESVKKVGFFDERFSVLHWHEFDYFTRAIRALGARASINDGNCHSECSSYNEVGCVITNKTGAGISTDEFHTGKMWGELKNLLTTKWGAHPNHSGTQQLKNAREINWYPFFWDGYDDIRKTFEF
jgi:hypothetical protein